MPPSSKSARSLACARCFRLKRRCDHAKPTCGECKRRGTECLPVKSYRDGEDITVPLKYLKHLEFKIAELEQRAAVTPSTSSQVRDIGVQTDLDESPSTDAPLLHTVDKASLSKEVLVESSPALPQMPLDSSNCSNIPSSQPPSHVQESATDLMLPDPLTQAQRLEGSLISRLAYEVYPDDMRTGYSPITDVDSFHAHDSTNESSFWFEEVYTNLYFSNTHWVWPFLDVSAWKSWHHDWNHGEEVEQWKGFFIQMVRAIGALSCSILHPEQGHLARAVEFYTSALTYYPLVMGHTSTILQIQASVLMILYALHCPSSEEMSMTVSSIAPFCSATISEIRKHTSSGIGSSEGDLVGSGEKLTESLFITCFMLNEIIVSGWDRPVSEAYRAIDEDMYNLSNEIPSSSNTSTALSHLFSLRKIQNNIRRSSNETPQQQESSDTLLRFALDTWRKDIPRYSIEDTSTTYLHPLWMANLYNYSIIIMMQEKRSRLQHDDVEDLVSASVEVCLSFRRIQEEGQVMCYTWSALVFQFRAAITLLYIFWVTPRGNDLVQQAFRALCACGNTLTHFADRWEDVTPYVKVFNFLFQRNPWTPEKSTNQGRYGCKPDEVKGCVEQLEKQYLHKAVLAMIEDMVYQRPVYDESLAIIK